MKTKRLVRLQTWTIIVLVAYALLAGCLLLQFPAVQPILSTVGGANSEIKTADLPRLQSDLRFVVSSLATFRHDRNELLIICFAATVGIVGFLGWSLFVISRLKRENLIDRIA